MREEKETGREEKENHRKRRKRESLYKLAVMKQLLLELPIVLLSIAMTHSVSDEREGVKRERRSGRKREKE